VETPEYAESKEGGHCVNIHSDWNRATRGNRGEVFPDFTPPKSAGTLASTGLKGDFGFQVGWLYILISNKRSICSCSGVGVLF
jgi:hypothetical protein